MLKSIKQKVQLLDNLVDSLLNAFSLSCNSCIFLKCRPCPFIQISSKFYTVGCLSLDETANWAETGKIQFWSWPSEINLKSSNTNEIQTTRHCNLKFGETPTYIQIWLYTLLCTKDIMTCNVVSKGYLNSQFFFLLDRERKKIANFFAHWGQKISEVIFDVEANMIVE